MRAAGQNCNFGGRRIQIPMKSIPEFGRRRRASRDQVTRGFYRFATTPPTKLNFALGHLPFARAKGRQASGLLGAVGSRVGLLESRAKSRSLPTLGPLAIALALNSGDCSSRLESFIVSKPAWSRATRSKCPATTRRCPWSDTRERWTVASRGSRDRSGESDHYTVRSLSLWPPDAQPLLPASARI